MGLYSFPTTEQLEHYELKTPAYMYPNDVPFAVVDEGYLSAVECAEITEYMLTQETYKWHGCDAVTRECPRPLAKQFNELITLCKLVNSLYYKYDIDWDSAGAYMQEYMMGSKYQLHADTAPGQTRKLTAVLMLTDPENYVGGGLILRPHPQEFVVPNAVGTVVIFQSHLLHEVRPLLTGIRRTINLGLWGPPFK